MAHSHEGRRSAASRPTYTNTTTGENTMKKTLIAIGLAAFTSVVWASCVTNTYFVNGKMTICTTCCYGSNCTTTCN
jgi:hypothetical protein